MIRPNEISGLPAGFLTFFVEVGIKSFFGAVDFFFAAFGVALAVFETLFACGLNPSCGTYLTFFVVLPGDDLLA